MAAVSPLHAFDNQLWEKLVNLVETQDLSRLLQTGDKATATKCLQAVHSLRISCKNGEGYLLSRALMANLKSLSIIVLSYHNVSKQTVQHVLQKIAGTNLIELELHDLDGGGWQLTLPSTLKKLDIAYHMGQAPSVTLGEAKLSYLSVYDPNLAKERASSCNLNVAKLIMSCAATLEHLSLLHSGSIPLDLSNHALLSNLTLHTDQLLPEHGFVAPPAVKRLDLMSFRLPTAYIQQVLSMFGPSLVDLTLSTTFAPLQTLDISEFANIEVLKFAHSVVPVICAPNSQLRIVCPRQLPSIRNNGTGSVSIQCTTLHLHKDILQADVMNHVDWSLVQHIHLLYRRDGSAAQYVDYGCFIQASNVQSITIQFDTLETFAARDGHHFLQMFPKLVKLEWDMDHELCMNLTSLGFVLPATVTNLELQKCTDGNATDLELHHLLDWMRHTPNKLDLVDIPLVPKMITICNDATSKLRFRYKSHCDSIRNLSIWANAPVFAPSIHVKQAKFCLCDAPSESKTRIMHRIFDYRSSDSHVRYPVISYAAPQMIIKSKEL